jgi:uncharacterized protein DUF4214
LNRAFVLMQYYGYLRRMPEKPGLDFWLKILNPRGNFRSMVCAFINSAEYQHLFSPSLTRKDLLCGSIRP